MNLGPYRLERALATGGMAEVFLARDPAGGPVVIKRLLEHLRDDDELVERFAREAALAAGLSHPNIVRVLATGDEAGAPWIAMEWLDGLDARALTDAAGARGERLAPEVACAIALDAARALEHAHAGGVVHRDVSPHNVFVGRDGATRLLDFGIARTALQSALSRAGETRGKLGYMAPEQLAGLAVDPRTDLFALGVVLWELLAGRRLWQRESDGATAYAIQQQGAPPPSAAAAKGPIALPAALDALVLSLLAKLPAGRPASAGVVAARLAPVLHDALGCTAPARAVAATVARFAPRGA